MNTGSELEVDTTGDFHPLPDQSQRFSFLDHLLTMLEEIPGPPAYLCNGLPRMDDVNEPPTCAGDPRLGE